MLDMMRFAGWVQTYFWRKVDQIVTRAPLIALGGMRIGSSVAPTQMLDVTGNITLSGFICAPPTIKTISGGAITATGSWHRVDTEGNAASDDLDTINGGVQGALLILSAQDASHDVVVKSSGGNIRTNVGSDVTLGDLDDHILLHYDATLSLWIGANGSG
jgi:hypothetical protein